MTTLKDKLLDALERALSSAAEQFLSVVLVMQVVSLTGLPWKAALSTAGGAFVVSGLLTVVQYVVGAQTLPFYVDLLVRAVKAFAASLLATLGGGVVDVLHVPWVSALDVAALAAFLSIVKGLLSPNAHLSPSLLPLPVVARLQKVQVTGSKFS